MEADAHDAQAVNQAVAGADVVLSTLGMPYTHRPINVYSDGIRIGKTTYSDMRRMEELVRGSDLEWTIMRPPGLFDAPAVTRYELHEDQAPGIFTSRADLAASLLEQAADVRFVRKAVADRPAGSSSLRGQLPV